MLKDITSIKFKGAGLDSLTSFDVFDPHDKYDGNKSKPIKGTLLFGRNGSGKSTIAKAFRKIVGEDVSIVEQAEVYGDDGNYITLTEAEKARIFVFDEDFVAKNVKMQEDHLETIVMLGPLADLTEKVNEARAKSSEIEKDFTKQKDSYEEYTNEKNEKSPQYYLRAIINALRGDANWAGRDKRIKENKVNSQVNSETYKQFVGIKPSKTRDELIIVFEEKLKELEGRKEGAGVVNVHVPEIEKQIYSYDENKVRELLAQKIEKPELSDREKKIVNLLQEMGYETIQKRLNFFKKTEIKECPYCYQPLSSDYKKSLVQSIEKVLNREMEEHIECLQQYLSFEIISMDLNPFEKLANYGLCNNLVQKINKSIEENQKKLKEKISNPYEPINISETTIKKDIEELSTALIELERQRVLYNEEAKKTNVIINELNRINVEITSYDISSYLKKLSTQQKKQEEAKQLFEMTQAKYEAIKKEINDLESSIKNIHIAIDSINMSLRYIFMSDERLKIVLEDESYKILVNGKRVRPCDVSVGERNVIGLSYFFTKILAGQNEENAYSNDYIIVLDDPISSYDMENRVGIATFLKYKLSEFLESNVDSKVLLMTHDLMTYYDSYKFLEEIKQKCDEKWKPILGERTIFKTLEMENWKLCEFKYRKRQEYTELMQAIYNYACGKDDSNELVIGNMMRQVLETFSTFIYKKGIEEVSTSDDVLNCLPQKEYVPYFKNSMYRLVLHGGSHKEEQIKSMKDLTFFDHISHEEKKRTAKDILSFIYLLNSLHLVEHLNGCSEVKETLDKWCEKILEMGVGSR